MIMIMGIMIWMETWMKIGKKIGFEIRKELIFRIWLEIVKKIRRVRMRIVIISGNVIGVGIVIEKRIG